MMIPADGFFATKDGDLYMVRGSNLDKFDAGDPLTLVWRSKLFRQSDPTTFVMCRVKMSDGYDPSTAPSDLLLTTDEGLGGCLLLVDDEGYGDCLLLGLDTTAATITHIVDDVVIGTYEVQDRLPFTINPVAGEDHEVELRSSWPIEGYGLAEDPEKLA